MLGTVSVVRDEGGRAHYTGLLSCGLTWSCPVCAARIAAERAQEVSGALERHLANGGGGLFVTLTMPHNYGQELERMRRTVSGAWRYTIAGRRWQQLRREHGIGFVRVLEVTHGANGWHPHIHALLLTNTPLSDTEARTIGAHVTGRWVDAIRRGGYGTPEQMRVEPIRSEAVANYVGKFGMALEVTQGMHKSGRRGNQHPFQILQDVADGDARAVGLWREYVSGMHGARQITWSRGLKAKLGVPEVEDEDIVAQDAAQEVIATFSADEWRAIRRVDGLPVAILEAAERSPDDIIQLLTAWFPEALESL